MPRSNGLSRSAQIGWSIAFVSIALFFSMLMMFAPGPAAAASSCHSPSHTSGGFGSLKNGEAPSACWRPYASSSPFNRKVKVKKAVERSESKTAGISRLAAHDPSYFVAGDEARDWGVATYYASSLDPTYTVHCTEPWGTCDLEGLQIRMPADATPSGVWPLQHSGDDWDSHLTVVDQEMGWEYDLWNVRSIVNGQIVIKWGGKTRIDGDGLGSDAVAARFGSLGGLIRSRELSAGRIRHALALTVPCTEGFVPPAEKGALECSDAGMPTEGAMPVGAHLRLKIKSRTIRRSGFPRWKKAILFAFKRYGAYIEDTTGDETQWALKFESPATQTSFGKSNEFVKLAKQESIDPVDYNENGQSEYWFDVGSGVNWGRLRVVN